MPRIQTDRLLAVAAVVGVFGFGCDSIALLENDCKQIANKLVQDRKPLTVSQVDRLRAGVAHLCVEDKWSVEARICMAGAKTERDGERCLLKLTKEQRDDLKLAALLIYSDGGNADDDSND